MKLTHLILFFTCISCNYSTKPTQQSKVEPSKKVNIYEGINQISFHLKHSMRIPNNKVDIEMEKASNGIFLRLTSVPMVGQSGWDSTKIDTVYQIKPEVFDKVLLSIRKISSIDLQSAVVSGFDGVSCEIRFGDYQNYISYNVWSPDYDAEERKTQDFLKACEQFILAANLNPKKIL